MKNNFFINLANIRIKMEYGRITFKNDKIRIVTLSRGRSEGAAINCNTLFCLLTVYLVMTSLCRSYDSIWHTLVTCQVRFGHEILLYAVHIDLILNSLSTRLFRCIVVMERNGVTTCAHKTVVCKVGKK